MLYLAEFKFLQKILNKFNLNSKIIDLDSSIEKVIDFGLKTFLNFDNLKGKRVKDFINPIENNTLYKIDDIMMCSYMLIPIPEDNKETELLFIGPFITKQLSREEIFALSEKLGLGPKKAKQLETYFSNIPYLPVDNGIFNVIDAFAEQIYGTFDNYCVKSLNKSFFNQELETQIQTENEDVENAMLNMQIMEHRYSYENQMMHAVTKGLTHKAELMLSSFSQLTFEARLSDPLRNAKNYCIIMNTLLRKAAEQGGVHPVYLNTTSSDFAKKIETLNSIHAVQGFMVNIFKTYCNLVNIHSMKNYSQCVQRVIVAIDSDLTADLSLNSLSKMLNISAGYLSSLFKKETGQTLTDFVNTKRIEHAITLLKTTNLQIQTIAQYCGIYDIQYFSKVFKKYTKKTPKEFRKTN